MVLGLEIRRHVEVIDEQRVVAQAPFGFHAVGDGARRPGLGDQRCWDAGLFLRLFMQGLDHAMPVADAAGDQIVELVGRHQLVLGAPADPELRRIADHAIAVQMHAIGADAEKGRSTPVEIEAHGAAPALGHGQELLAPFGNGARSDQLHHRLVDRRGECRRIALCHQPHRIRSDQENPREAAQHLGMVASH